MKFISLIFKILILIVFLILAINNLQKVPFFYLPAQQIDLPLIALLFGFFVIGAVFGVLSMFGRLLALRSENSRLRREVEKTARISAQDLYAPAPLPHNPAPVAETHKKEAETK